jgi:hypothetical protein
MQQFTDEFETWKEIVSKDSVANLEGVTFYDFIFKLDAEIKKINRRNAAIKKRNR